MSDVAAPSFFPTPMEIAGGLRWVREHPVVATAAAAAATAVSVLHYLKSVSDEQGRAVEAAGPHLVKSKTRGQLLSPTTAGAEELCSSTESDASTPSQARAASPRSLSFCELDGELDAPTSESPEERALEAALAEQADADAASPQWGWYVSTTPPEDRYS